MGLKETAQKFGLKQVFNWLERDPEENLPKIMNWIDRFAGDDILPNQREAVRNVVADRDSIWHKYMINIMEQVDQRVLRTIFTNLIVNIMLVGWKRQQQIREENQCNVPWAILLDPTSACNLHCTGCWAAEYGNKLNLTYDEIDSIIQQGKDIGCYLYIYTGGEPLVRKKDVLALCEKHDDCLFLCFTNATLIDEQFADDMLRVTNFIPAISLEGFEEATDGRRGEGVYQKVIHAMELLKERHLPYGISACYTSANIESIASDAFMDKLLDMGAYFVWFFHYMPVGNAAAPELLPTPQQREWFYHQVRDDFRKTKPIFVLDFQNDGEFVGGCIAGGRRFFHINANGDCDPCVFIHYSDSNIREKSLMEVLKSPLFMAYHDNQPFNENHLRPCPMLENPQRIQELVHSTDVHSTDLESPESVEHLTEKTVPYAENWKPTADKLWAVKHGGESSDDSGEEACDAS